MGLLTTVQSGEEPIFLAYVFKAPDDGHQDVYIVVQGVEVLGRRLCLQIVIVGQLIPQRAQLQPDFRVVMMPSCVIQVMTSK